MFRQTSLVGREIHCPKWYLTYVSEGNGYVYSSVPLLLMNIVVSRGLVFVGGFFNYSNGVWC